MTATQQRRLDRFKEGMARAEARENAAKEARRKRRKAEPPANGHAGAQAPAPAAEELIPLDRIRPSPLNPRRHFDPARLAELTESVRQHGVLQPVLVWAVKEKQTVPVRIAKDLVVAEVAGTREVYELLAGERRLRAAQAAGLATIPAKVLAVDAKGAAEIRLLENEQREDLSPLERADGYAHLIEAHGHTVATLAARLGKAESTLRELLALRKLPAKARKAVEDGTLPPATAALIARVPTPASRDKLAQEVLDGPEYGYEGDGRPLSYRETRAWIAEQYTRELSKAPFDRKSLDLVEAAGSCEACPKRAGNMEGSDARADVCTDTECYAAKIEAHKSRALADAHVKGQRVLSDAEAKKAMPYGGHVAYGAPYYDLAADCYEVGSGRKRKSYGKLLGKHLPEKDVVLAVDERGELHRLVSKDVALPLLREHCGAPPPHKDSPAADRTSAEDKAEKARRRADNRLRRETTREVLARACEAGMVMFGGLLDGADVGVALRALARELTGSVWPSILEDVVGRRGVKAQRVADVRSAVEDLIQQGGGPQLMGLMLECVAGRQCNGASGNDKGLGVALGIDRKACEKAARERLKAGKKPTGDRPPPPDLSASVPLPVGPVRVPAGEVGRDAREVGSWSAVGGFAGVTERHAGLLAAAGLGTLGAILGRAGGRSDGNLVYRVGKVLAEVKGLTGKAREVLTHACFTAAQPSGQDAARPSPELTEGPGTILGPKAAGVCRCCGCRADDCQGCVERTGEPCTWASAKEDLCSACEPLLHVSVSELSLSAAVVKALEAASLPSIGHLHGLATLPPGEHWTRPGLGAKAHLATLKGVGKRHAQAVVDAVDTYLQHALSCNDDGSPRGLEDGELLPED